MKEDLSHQKLVFKKNYKSKVSVINIIPEAILINGCAMMRSILRWPKGGKVSDLLVALTL